jgi:uncharacterized protein (TIGR00369 family)
MSIESNHQFSSRIEFYQHIIQTTQFHAPIGEFLGLKLVDVGQGTASFTMDVKPEFMNSVGVLHGGIVTTISDAAMGIACGSLLDFNTGMTTIELKINFIRPLKSGQLRGNGRVVNKGARTAIVEAEVINEAGKLIAKTQGTMLLFPIEQENSCKK